MLPVLIKLPVDFDRLIPRDRRRRYDRVQVLKCGLYFPIGSYHWLWLTDTTDLSSALQSCQPVIESLKSSMPEYHTHARQNAIV